MIDALYTGISGLNGFQNALNTESNNIANVNTIAFKSDNISFADQMYQNSIGKGVSVETIDKNFLQGNLKVTSGAYDMAIEGKGFFIVKGDTEELHYTRAGDFRMAEDGTLQTSNGFNVQGINSSIPTILSTDADSTVFTNEYTTFLGSQVIQSNNGTLIENVNVKTTNFNLSAQNDSDTQKGDNYKTKESKISDVEALATAYRSELSLYSTLPIEGVAATNQTSNIAYDQSKFTNSLDSIELVIGTTQYIQPFITDSVSTLKALADQISNTKALSASVDNNGILTVTSMIPGEAVNVSDAKILNGESNVFPAPIIDTTAAITGNGKAKLDVIELALKSAVEAADAKFLRQTTTIDTLNTTNVSDIQLRLDTLSYSDSAFGTPEIVDGVIYISQGDNRFAIGKVSTALFSNELGLNPQGGNLYTATATSGEAIYATNENKILGQTLELSNSDLGEGLVNLMVYQRSFEANSKAVTTSDEFLKTALALKK